MGLIQLIVTILFGLTYTMAFFKHGERRDNKDVTRGSLGWTMIFIHALFFWGGFYKTFGSPQGILLAWDVAFIGYAMATVDDEKHYNFYRSALDAFVTFSCLYAGGFYTNGIPTI